MAQDPPPFPEHRSDLASPPLVVPGSSDAAAQRHPPADEPRHEELPGVNHPLTHERQQTLLDLLAGLGLTSIESTSLWLYDQALTHSSYTYENSYNSLLNYERLEFLGDAVLKLLISDYLYGRFPHYREGELTKIRAVVVSDAVLAELSAQLGLGEYIVFGVNEARSGGARKSSNLACAFEALMGALYLDGQQEPARQMLYHLIEDAITDIDLNKTKDNFKAVLQEYTQGEGLGLPEYVTVKESGPSHNRTFTIEARVNGEVLGFGQGKSKKEAQQAAARLALMSLDQLEDETDPLASS